MGTMQKQVTEKENYLLGDMSGIRTHVIPLILPDDTRGIKCILIPYPTIDEILVATISQIPWKFNFSFPILLELLVLVHRASQK